MGRSLWVGIGAISIAIAGLAAFAIKAPAQSEPEMLPPSVRTTTNPPELQLPPPPRSQDDDDDVQPAQFTTPGVPVAGSSGSVQPVRSALADPPSPVVRIQVRVPAHTPPGDDIKYIITVQNTSTAEAHSVTVRNPLPEAIEAAVKAEPEWNKVQPNPKELVWSFGTLAPGKSKVIELTLRPKKEATEVKNLAYVRFEHGEAVTTKIHKPAVRVTKVAPKQTVQDETYTVRVAVDNTGKVAAENIRLAENVPASAEVEPITKGAKKTQQPEGQQWVWEIPKLMPGERRIFEYRVTPREAKDVFALTSLSAGKGVTDRAEARTLVLVPGLTVKLVGPTANAPVAPGEAAKYEITVRNTGTLPSTNVRVTGTLPADCKPTMKTEGGQLYRDAIQWVVPRLEPGEAQTFRFAVKATTTGRRVVVASIADARGQRAADELATVFQGTASLSWETEPKPVSLAVGRQGTFTVKVRNGGGEVARNVKVEVDLPDAVNLVQVTPNVSPKGGKLVFGPESIAAYGDATYTITYEAKQSTQAWFKLKMTADCLGERPLATEKMVDITGGGK
ncbi:MAG: DUF11 domain-containing protein [Planctomycetes bacterium]|nr:DUF11 domain-containing protein [Planctomycetota bacterium]